MIYKPYMTPIHNKALKRTISVSRLLGKIEGRHKGPTIVFYGGIHGNETAGVFALKEAFKKIDPEHVHGTIYGISGNLKALARNQRYVDEDLNRIWLKANLKEKENKLELNSEEFEQQELYRILSEILDSESSAYYFIDLHTTSSKTLPFITINDALINRKFSSLFPVPIVLGIEEYLEGPLLSYINKLGYVSLGFESGQHDEPAAITNAVAFVFLSLVFSNLLNQSNVPNFKEYYNQLEKEAEQMKDVFEVIHLFRLKDHEAFKMEPNFKSFQNVNNGQLIARSNDKRITSPYNAKIFMPLYQDKGREGFFIIKRINPFFLKLSEVLRRIKIDNLLTIFPGVSWRNKKEGVLQVNLKVAKYMVKPIFHLLGYRNKQIDGSHLNLFNRERTSKKNMYKNLFNQST